MKWFIRLNLMSAIFAFPLFISLELMGNVYRIGRLTGWDIGKVSRITDMYGIAGFVISTILFIYIVRHWMEGRTARYASVILSILYLYLFIFIFRTLFPMTHPGDRPNPASGLIAIGLLILYPFYLVVINLFVDKN